VGGQSYSLETYNTYSANCRLPQTPRTPSTAAAHYFDDILIRQKQGGPRPLRRSSTIRNLGNVQLNDDDDDDDGIDFRRVNSIGYLDEEDLKRKAEIDQHIATYAAGQLQRLRTNDSASVNGMQDEIETQLDGASDWEQISEWEVQGP
jgi:hypothetical protein